MLISWCSNGKHPPCMRAFLLRSCAAFVNKLLVFKRQTSSLSAGLANGGLLHTDDSGFPEMHTRPLNRSAPIAANYHALVQSASIRDENKPDTAALQLSVLTRRTMVGVLQCWTLLVRSFQFFTVAWYDNSKVSHLLGRMVFSPCP